MSARGDYARATGPLPLIVRSGTLNDGHHVHYRLNYSPGSLYMPYGFGSGHELLSGKPMGANTKVGLPPCGFALVEEDASAAQP